MMEREREEKKKLGREREKGGEPLYTTINHPTHTRDSRRRNWRTQKAEGAHGAGGGATTAAEREAETGPLVLLLPGARARLCATAHPPPPPLRPPPPTF